MMVIMKSGRTQQELDDVFDRVRAEGFEPHPVYGDERTVVAVVGEVRPHPELYAEIAAMDGVEATIPISKPYKLASNEWQTERTVVDVSGVSIGPGIVTIIAGPCSVDKEEILLESALAAKEHGASILRAGAFKPRTSPYGFRGHGRTALRMMAKVRAETGLPLVTEVVSEKTVDDVAEHADMLQLGTRNGVNYELIEALAKTGKPLLIKRHWISPVDEWLLAAEYALKQGNKQVVLCERGIRTNETGTRNTMDINAIPLVHKLSHLPVIADPSHATGHRDLVIDVALGMVAAGAEGIMVEMHPHPEKALSDGAQSLKIDMFAEMMSRIRPVVHAVGKVLESEIPREGHRRLERVVAST